ncbi:peptide deformylase [Geovibrio thiophilus]|uniref:Peptide deformylase n=1 Tax=Geovibrio thiophilus TaxID=139438 RepID=A0A410JXN8_9BACT|nr:peptide deformylase [Geovibrio thiophilus]QAR32942.1 peptide deformylase [Geovibrio thiophilus]
MHEHIGIALRGEKVLSLRAEAAEDPSGPLIRQLAKDMLIAMKTHGGVGIAAPQIRVSKRVLIIHSKPNERYPDAPEMEPVIMVNPEIISYSECFDSMWEGCLSVPGLRGLVPRQTGVSVRYHDLTGKEQEACLQGFPARIFQHEFDHLEGILFPLRVADCSDIYSENEYRRRIQGLHD